MSVVSRLEPRKSEGRREEGDVGMPFFIFIFYFSWWEVRWRW
jgi:hypothetical protein